MEAEKDLLLRTKFMELKSKVLAKLNEERYAIVMKWESQSEWCSLIIVLDTR